MVTIIRIIFVSTKKIITQKYKKMNKTVKYNGENIKVKFETKNHTRVVTRMEGIRIAEAHGTVDFVINEKIYTTSWDTRYKKVYSLQRHFEGFTCGDSEKKMIEFIISKYGI